MLKTKELTLGAMGCALTSVLLLICTIAPTGKLAIGFIASFIPCVLYVECKSAKTAVLSGIASGIIALTLLPKHGLAGVIIVMYGLCFSYYPGLKAIIEKRRKLGIEWILKEIYFIILSLILKWICSMLGLEFFNLIIAVTGFTLYDLLLSYVISYYIKVISPRIQKSR